MLNVRLGNAVVNDVFHTLARCKSSKRIWLTNREVVRSQGLQTRFVLFPMGTYNWTSY